MVFVFQFSAVAEVAGQRHGFRSAEQIKVETVSKYNQGADMNHRSEREVGVTQEVR